MIKKINNYINHIMFEGFTKQEKRILIFFSAVILLGLGVLGIKRKNDDFAAEIVENPQEAKSPGQRKGEANEAPKVNDSLKAEYKKKKMDTGPLPGGVKININTASSERLQLLEGIGPATAKKIIKFRKEQDGFNNIGEINNVYGIGSKTFQKLKEFITVKDQTHKSK